jgi:hypothetical protein
MLAIEIVAIVVFYHAHGHEPVTVVDLGGHAPHVTDTARLNSTLPVQVQEPPIANLSPPKLPTRASARRAGAIPTTRDVTGVSHFKAKNNPKSGPAKKDGLDRPIARQALDLVGADPMAEAIWAQAINDPMISAHERQDLIEDLNENGFDDPAHPSADDLPLIENRLAIIEELAPLAMDDVNAAAFAEAYKDLVKMHAKAMAD